MRRYKCLINFTEEIAAQSSSSSLPEPTQENLETIIDMAIGDDSDFEPGTDRELLGLFFPEVCHHYSVLYWYDPHRRRRGGRFACERGCFV